MQNLRTRLPPANSLIAFEASARHCSFTRAAEELTISREAVSRHIRILENHLGVKLFTRLHRAIELTVEGEAFQAVVRKSLEDIAQSADRLQGNSERPRVVVSATIAISTYWLTPRLPKFRAAFPDTEIRVVVSDAPLKTITEDFDIALRYGDGSWRNFDCVHLFDVASHPVCAPAYLEEHGPISAPSDLTAHTLLNLDGASHVHEGWAWWLHGNGVTPQTPLRILGFDNYGNIIQAALDGQGVALGFSGIIDTLLDKGALVCPIKATHSRGLGVYAARPETKSLKPPARTFFDWVLSEAHTHTGL